MNKTQDISFANESRKYEAKNLKIITGNINFNFIFLIQYLKKKKIANILIYLYIQVLQTKN